ncbi:tubulin folding cofactor D C terminal-domain-containing protein [Lasiosphaeria miniovina]|uniref:Tubulin folding cofactor D C terminal-domain-containing protein n=1 Tax=Lasiosphaeria miniovina TaxID=1954250 RepID=A0AA40DG61_9PEZI|nr:tubulin folding cofactor D C terminal-domain-containing protein [Lasiosphaeria miniovina]KAK0701855.1 tubulin folding cofactor D C terminal-domain-containing protein [Lasiosphaeria miniovina]
MDAPEEDLDIKLQKASSELIADFDRSLGPFLRKADGSGSGSGGTKTTPVRSRVRARETGRLISSLLDPFQELPQLLDPHLPRWLPLLADAFLEYQEARRRQPKVLSTRSELLMPLPTAICKLLYTFCKIRGEKVIVRFLGNETRYLELLLSAVEEAERRKATATATASQWTWEERYVVLLWLSHLMLAPFDLATISSVEVDDDDLPRIAGFRWPAKLPGITTRILPLAINYLASPGKERDAAKALLVRIAMRKDMQQLGLLDALVPWAMAALWPEKHEPEPAAELKTPYHYIGLLSFLSGILVASADTSDMDRHLVTLFNLVHEAASEEARPEAAAARSSVLSSSALARKMAIKVVRAIAVLTLRHPQQDDVQTQLVETTIGFLLESLGDNDTPVRLAASKALSVITLKLDADMASQVVEAVLDSLNRNVLRVKGDPTKKNLSAVNPLEWHGLMLTLAHLLYRRSPPAETLSDIVHALLLGLSFEMRSASGGSMGTNVRDAACFGIWALARRYTTKELLAVPTTSASVAGAHNPQASILQILATELAVAASLDSAGNIRRGSSAALQELIGRHPDTVDNGIAVVQAVDYHAVALRSRALRDVAMAVTRLSPQYGEAILDGLLGWRGIGDGDATARRAAAASYGMIAGELAATGENPVQKLNDSAALVLHYVKSLQARQVEERHGLLLSFAAVLDSLPATVRGVKVADSEGKPALDDLVRLSTSALIDILSDCDTQAYRRPELVAEAASRLTIASFPVLQASALLTSQEVLDNANVSRGVLRTGTELVSNGSSTEISTLVNTLAVTTQPTTERFVSLAKSILGKWLARPEQEVISAASEAGLVLLVFCPRTEREQVIRGWANAVRRRPTSTAARASAAGGGYFSALVMSYSIIPSLELPSHEEGAALVAGALVDRWAQDKDIEARVAILSSLMRSDLLRQNTGAFLGLLVEGLDDYTINARGDVGSHVRLQALRAIKSLWEVVLGEGEEKGGADSDEETVQDVVSELFLRVLRLAAEKLDRVRVEAQAALGLALKLSYAADLRRSTFSSKSYFRFLLELLAHGDWLHPVVAAAMAARTDPWMEELMEGFVSSADTGNEELVIATRAALCEFCGSAEQNAAAICTALVANLKKRTAATDNTSGQDRVLIPTLEVTAFLCRAGIFAACPRGTVNYKSLCLYVQRAGYKSGNVRKIEACVKVYAAIAGGGTATAGGDGGVAEACKRLAALLVHPWPHVRNLVVDEVWALLTAFGGAGADAPAAAEKLKGVDWGRADKAAVRSLVEALGLTAA